MTSSSSSAQLFDTPLRTIDRMSIASKIAMLDFLVAHVCSFLTSWQTLRIPQQGNCWSGAL
eukprot:4443012-Pleurochrysis_carterae.AAC.1